jgi:hypothetical protein
MEVPSEKCQVPSERQTIDGGETERVQAGGWIGFLKEFLKGFLIDSDIS